MPLVDFRCSKCGYEIEVLTYNLTEKCIECGSEMVRIFSNPPMIKIKGAGGYPSRRKQVRNTTSRNHPQLEHEKNRVYYG